MKMFDLLALEQVNMFDFLAFGQVKMFDLLSLEKKTVQILNSII